MRVGTRTQTASTSDKWIGIELSISIIALVVPMLDLCLGEISEVTVQKEG